MPLKDFLLGLMDNPAKLAEFRWDPHTVLDKADLSDEERTAILSGDNARIQAMLGADGGPINTQVVLQVSPGGPPRTPVPNPDRPPPGPRTPKPEPTRKHPSTPTPKPPSGDTPPKKKKG